MSNGAFVTLATIGFTIGGVALVIGAMFLNLWLDDR